MTIVVVVVVVVLLLALVAFVVRDGASPRRRTRPKEQPAPDAWARAPQEPLDAEQVDRLPDVGGRPGVTGRETAEDPRVDGRAASPDEADDASPDEADDGDVAFELGVLLYERGHLDPAEAAWRRAVKRRHARAATRLGMALERRGDIDGASRAYEDAERWGDAVGSERAAALRRPDQSDTGPRPR